MATQVTNYQCPACTGPLHFVGESGKLECDYCGSKFTVEEVEAFYAEKDAQAEETFAQEQSKAEDVPEGESEWDTSSVTNDWGEDGENMRAYTCPSCGAELICEATTAATSCPYCNNPTIIPGQFAGTMKPDLIIPFKLDKKAAISALKRHYMGKFLLPKVFKKKNHIEEIKGLYVPFWLYDAKVDADCTYRATRTTVHHEGDYEVTTTHHYLVERSGTMDFEKIPADGSSKMPDDYMDSIEPYDYQGLKDFSTAYLPGYLADKYDVSAKECAARADKRSKNSVLSALERDVVGYQSVFPKNKRIHVSQGKIHYALMPVWTLRTRWQDKDYVFMMNGQTGKMVGDLPIDKKKSQGIFWGLVFACTAAFTALGVGRFLAGAIVWLLS